MPSSPARRRSFLSLRTATEDGAQGLTTHRSFTSGAAALALASSSADGNTTPRAGGRGTLPSTQQQPQQQLLLPPPSRSLSTRDVVVAAVLLVLAFASGTRWCVGGCCTGGTSGGILEGRADPALAGLPPDPRNRPYYDLVVAVLAIGGDSTEAQEEIARVRRVYARYGSEVVPAGGSAYSTRPLTFRVVFVVGRAGLPDGAEPGVAGLLLGDFYHVDVREGYAHLSDKTKAMAGLEDHLRFSFLAKTDGDTFPCLSRVAQQLVNLPAEQQPRVYAGMLNKCGTVFPEGHKLHDPEFLAATGGTLGCHPMYHQGAFYILGRDIVHHLNRSRDVLSVMSVEDAMMGLWLLGIDKVILDIGGSFYCKCFTHPVPKQKLSFYHFCKTDEKMDKCLQAFGAC